MTQRSDPDASTGTLLLATLAVAVAFASWGLFAVVGVDIRGSLGLSQTEFGLLLASPMLFGALLCVPVGMLAERWGGKRTMLVCLAALAPVLLGLSFARDFPGFLLAGAGLGFAAGLFCAGLPYTAAFSRNGREGFSLGLFGSGMLGAGITYLVAPMAAEAYGWRTAPLIYTVLVLVVTLLFWMLAEDDSPERPCERISLRGQLATLIQPQVWQLCLYYSFVFGGFVALVLWLPDYMAAHYGIPLKTAAMLSLVFTIPGALTQLVGGLLADIGGARQVNWWVFWICLVALFFLSYPPSTITVHGIEQDLQLSIHMPLPLFLVLIMITGIAMGFGKGSVLRLAFNNYPDRLGMVGGAMVAFGGLMGFILPILFGMGNDLIGVRSATFMLLYGLLALCMVVMYLGTRIEEHRRRLARAREDEFMQYTAPLSQAMRSSAVPGRRS